MTREDRARWDAKYRGARPAAPSPTLIRQFDRIGIASGRALDVACGTGANSLFLAERGLCVDAVDVSGEALGILAASARERGLEDRVRPVQIDLDRPALAERPERHRLVISISFLHRPLLPLLPRLLAPGGVILFETFHVGYLDVRKGFRREWVLERGEEERLFPELERIDAGHDDTRAFLLARRR